MKIYKDKNLTQELESETFDLGIVPAGESKIFTFYVLNDSDSFLKDLKFMIDHKEVKILEFPKELKTQEIGKLIIEWSPSVTLKEGLKAILYIKGKELYGGRG